MSNYLTSMVEGGITVCKYSFIFFLYFEAENLPGNLGEFVASGQW